MKLLNTQVTSCQEPLQSPLSFPKLQLAQLSWLTAGHFLFQFVVLHYGGWDPHSVLTPPKDKPCPILTIVSSFAEGPQLLASSMAAVKRSLHDRPAPDGRCSLYAPRTTRLPLRSLDRSVAQECTVA